MNRVQCFMIERTDIASRSFRRFVFSDKAPSKCSTGRYGYHNRSVLVDAELPFVDDKYEGRGDIPGAEERSDPRWPTHCECGYEFQPEDQWQVNLDRMYRMPDGSLVDPEKAPAGAMWYSPTYEDVHGYRGPDGKCLLVMLPCGTSWVIDGPANNSKKPWDRTGVPPNVTANPSILTSKYHGWLRNGWLEEC